MTKKLSLCALVVLLLVTAASAKDAEELGTPIYGCVANIQEIAKQNAFYREEHGGYPKTLKLTGVRRLNCPVSRQPYIYKLVNKGKDFLLYCPGHTHKLDGARKDHPWYHSDGRFEVR